MSDVTDRRPPATHPADRPITLKRGRGRPTAAEAVPIPDDIVETLIERLDRAISTGLLPINLAFYQCILAGLFPEHFGRELPLADSATDTQPFTEQRVHVWTARAKAKRCLWHPNDAQTTAIAEIRPRRR